MDDDISGFTVSPVSYGEADISTFTLIHSSEEGFYAIYRGERSGMFRAYKCLKPEWRGAPLQEAMLKKEFEMGYPLRHQNICETIQYTSVEGLGNCIEMEWIDGVTLGEFLERGRPAEKLFRKLAGELCDALAYLHNRQTIHRDIKPSNIMVTHDGCCIKLIDFSLADCSRSSLLKAPAGTRNYMAPEVLQGKQADARSDIWSLGKVLQEMTNGYRRAIARCLCPDPDKRYRSIDDLRETLFARNHIPLAVKVILTVLLAFAVLQLIPRKDKPQPGAEVTAAPADTIPAAPADNSVQEPPAVKKQQPKGQKKEEKLDDIFQQATDLFEDRLQ